MAEGGLPHTTRIGFFVRVGEMLPAPDCIDVTFVAFREERRDYLRPEFLQNEIESADYLPGREFSVTTFDVVKKIKFNEKGHCMKSWIVDKDDHTYSIPIQVSYGEKTWSFERVNNYDKTKEQPQQYTGPRVHSTPMADRLNDSAYGSPDRENSSFDTPGPSRSSIDQRQNTASARMQQLRESNEQNETNEQNESE